MPNTQPNRLQRFAAAHFVGAFVCATFAALPMPLAADEPTKMYAQRSAKSNSQASETGDDNKKIKAATIMALENTSEEGEGEGLEIRGQTRTLSMMLVLQSRRDKIDFIKPRKDYRDRILQTEY
jgi:hypothetical protein